MATTYRLILMDENDWDYVGRTRTRTVEQIKASDKNYEVVASLYGMIIVNTHRDYPEKAIEKMNKCGVIFDVAYHQTDNNMELIEFVEYED